MKTSPSKSPSRAVPLPKWAIWTLGSALALSLFGNAYALGRQSTNQPVPAATVSATGSTKAAAKAAPPVSVSAMKPGQSFDWTMAVRNLNDHSAALTRGPNGTVVELMASWCLFCGYTDQYALPTIAKTPGVAIDVVDVSPLGGIANPGPANPPFHGKDGQASPVNTRQMASTMQQYKKDYNGMTGMNLYVAPSATRSLLHITSIPVLIWINKAGMVTKVTTGGLLPSQAQSLLQNALGIHA